MTYLVRHGTAADLDQIVALERITENAPHWPQSSYASILLSSQEALRTNQETFPARCLLVAGAEGRVVGFAVGLISTSDRVAELESVAVAASARGIGIGRALCTAVIDWCSSRAAESILLEVRSRSPAAIALYISLGFLLEGHRARYYSDPEDDALLFRLGLRGAATRDRAPDSG